MLKENYQLFISVETFFMRAAPYMHLAQIFAINVILMILKYWLSNLVLFWIVEYVSIKLFDIAFIQIYLI